MTDTPKIQPASDADIAEIKRTEFWKKNPSRVVCPAEPMVLRIEADRADVGRLRARVAELEAALSELETRIFALGSDGPICQLHRLKLSALVDFIRAALKPEPR